MLICLEGKQLPRQEIPQLLQINVTDVRCNIYKVSWQKRHLIWAELPAIPSYFFIVYLFHLKMYPDNRYILSVSLLPELIESHTWSQMDKWVTFGTHTAEASLLPLSFCRGMFTEEIGFTVCIQQYI